MYTGTVTVGVLNWYKVHRQQAPSFAVVPKLGHTSEPLEEH